MKATTTSHRKFRQSRINLTRAEWVDYRALLVSERSEGNVSGWTTLPVSGGVVVIVTHK